MPGDDKLLSSLERETQPPDGLEDRVVQALQDRGLLGARALRPSSPWRLPLAAAAAIAVLTVGVLIGRTTAPSGFTDGTVTGMENNVYALLLFENPEYDAPQGPEMMTRYGEYGRWVATAVERKQFLAGEDLEASQGWVIEPSDDGPVIGRAAALAEGAPLSGVFFIRANNAEDALQLAAELPHLRHGGKVVVQRTIPTLEPPQ